MTLTLSLESLTDHAALTAAHAALDEGRAMGKRMCVAVLDVSGVLLAFLRANGSYPTSVDIAMDKAYTALVFGQSTDVLRDRLSRSDILRDSIAARDRVCLLGGGFPVLHQGAVIGAIGCSGGSEDDDCQCARAALQALSALQAASPATSGATNPEGTC